MGQDNIVILTLKIKTNAAEVDALARPLQLFYTSMLTLGYEVAMPNLDESIAYIYKKEEA